MTSFEDRVAAILEGEPKKELVESIVHALQKLTNSYCNTCQAILDPKNAPVHVKLGHSVKPISEDEELELLE